MKLEDPVAFSTKLMGVLIDITKETKERSDGKCQLCGFGNLTETRMWSVSCLVKFLIEFFLGLNDARSNF